MKGILLIFCSLVLMSGAKDEVSVIQALSDNVGEMVLKCQNELEFKPEVIRDLLDFWNDKNNLTSEDLGCALVCVLEKNEFLSEDGSIVQQDKVYAFYQGIGADDVLSNHLVDLFLLCKKQSSSIKNFCNSTLEMAKCYRYGIFTMHWNPVRFYWKKYQRFGSNQVLDKICRGPICTDISKTKSFKKLFRTC